MKTQILSIFLVFSFLGNAQVGIGTVTPDPSAVLDMSSMTQGVLVPRMDSDQRIAIANPAKGLLVFDTVLNSFYYHNGSNWVEVGSAAVAEKANDYTGWADYVDGVYTSSNPFELTPGNKVLLPNAANTIRDSQKPVDITTFYDSTNKKITGRNGDGVNILIEFKAKPTSTTAITRLTVSIDIGLASGEIYNQDFLLEKGRDVEHFYLSSFDAYTLDTWETNGGEVKIVSTAAADIYDIRYIITRTHKAR